MPGGSRWRQIRLKCSIRNRNTAHISNSKHTKYASSFVLCWPRQTHFRLEWNVFKFTYGSGKHRCIISINFLNWLQVASKMLFAIQIAASQPYRVMKDNTWIQNRRAVPYDIPWLSIETLQHFVCYTGIMLTLGKLIVYGAWGKSAYAVFDRKLRISWPILWWTRNTKRARIVPHYGVTPGPVDFRLLL